MSRGYIDQDPFAHERDLPHVQAALRDIVTVRDSNGVQRSSGDIGMDGYGADDIIASYSTEPQQQQQRRQQQNQLPKANVGRSKTTSGYPEKGKERERTSSRSKTDMPLDVIDRLDISGLYGGGSLQRHDGPYAAATASRNQGPRSPMAAFDPAALAAPGPRPSVTPRKSSKNLSARAQATLAAMDDYDGAGRDGPYGGAAMTGRQTSRRRGSDSSVNMGYPDRKAGKGAQLIEMYGVRDVEAWEDYGRRDYKGGDHSGSSSRESVIPNGVSKEDRMERAQSIWDIEATLAAGKPVGQAPPPPMPVFPASDSGAASGYETYANGNGNANKPKRSKSLAARLRGGRKSGSGAEGNDEPLPSFERGHNGGQSPQTPPATSHNPQYSPLQLDTNASVGDEHSRQQYRQGVAPISPVDRFKDGEGYGFPGARSTSRESGGAAGGGSSFSSSPSSASAMDGPGMSRRPSVMQRLFSSKRKDKESKA